MKSNLSFGNLWQKDLNHYRGRTYSKQIQQSHLIPRVSSGQLERTIESRASLYPSNLSLTLILLGLIGSDSWFYKRFMRGDLNPPPTLSAKSPARRKRSTKRSKSGKTSPRA